MKRILFLFFLTILNLNRFYSQDKLYKPDGTLIEAKIIEVSNIEIKYKKSNNKDGPLFVIPKSEILMIVYSNGETEVVKKQSLTNEKLIDTTLYGRNIIGFNPIALAFNNFNIYYETISKKGQFGLKIPIFIGLSGNYYVFGFYGKIYPTHQGKVRGFFGPAFQGGSNNFYDNKNTYGYLAFLANGGVSFQPLKTFNITIDGSIGQGYLPHNKLKFLDYNIGVNFGLRF